MLSIALNPGFVLLIGALLAAVAPARFRPPLMTLAALGALALLLAPDFGRYDAFAQIGLMMVPLTLDELNQTFGLAFIGISILLAMYGSGRRARFEDVALLLLAGAATTALFVGDLVSFVAALSLAGLSAVWIVFAADTAGARAAGARLLIWLGLESLLLLAGVAFLLSDGLRNEFGAMDSRGIGGALFLGGLAIRVGAPFAHVWLRDCASEASPVGAAAIALFPALLGLYGLARAFPNELALVYVGIGMVGVGALFALAQDDLRSAAAYSFTAQLGLAVAAVGLGSPQALAGVAAYAFGLAFAFALVFLALGVLRVRFGASRASMMHGALDAAPISVALALTGAAAAALTPGFAPYAGFALMREAAFAGPLPWLGPAFGAGAALAFLHLLVRPAMILGAPPRGPEPARAPAFMGLLACAVAAFILLASGLAPGWLYGLAPFAPASFAPFAPERLGPHLAALGAAGAVYCAVLWARLAPTDRAVRVADIDALYGGPLMGAGRWLGVVLLRLYGAWRALSVLVGAQASKALVAFAQRGDLPYRDQAAGGLALLGLALFLILTL